jgi:hypothetical protein
VVVYTLLMVPVVYGGAKLISSPTASGADWSAGVAAIIVIPMPVLAFWAYVLISWHRALVAAERGDLKRSRSSILRAYGSGTAGEPEQLRRPSAHSNTQRGPATLALLGDDNPTLIIRDRKSGEETFEQFQDDDSDSDDGALGGTAPAITSGPSFARPMSSTGELIYLMCKARTGLFGRLLHVWCSTAHVRGCTTCVLCIRHRTTALNKLWCRMIDMTGVPCGTMLHPYMNETRHGPHANDCLLPCCVADRFCATAGGASVTRRPAAVSFLPIEGEQQQQMR